jgi:hypothetical protein
MGGFDVIFISPSSLRLMDFFIKKIGFNVLTTNFWHENLKCYELDQIMRQNDVHFINILNRFQTGS